MSDKEILSEEEKAALLDEAAAPNEGEAPQSFDFANQERIVKNQFPVLERIHERFAKKLKEDIYDFMAREINIEVDELQFGPFCDFMAGVSMPAGIHVVRARPLRGRAFIILSAELLFSVVENYFGGTGQFKLEMEEREFTPTETRIEGILVDLIFRNLVEAWSPIMAIEFEEINYEMNPQLVRIHTPSELMMISTFQLGFGDISAELAIMMPYTMLDPHRELLDMGASGDDDEMDPNWQRSLREELLDVPLTLSSVLSKVELPLDDLLSLKVGELIPIELSENLPVYVENIPTFTANYGVYRDKISLKIIEKLPH